MDTEGLKQKLRAAVLPNCNLKLAVSKLLIDKFAKKLSVDDLLTLANLVTSEETESALSSSQCIFIENKKRLSINNRCYSPISCCIQMWRWGPFDDERAFMHKEFVDLNASNRRMCINPYHYESTEPEESNEESPEFASTVQESVIKPMQVQSPENEAALDPNISNNECRVCLTTGVLFDWRASMPEADPEVTYAECFYESTQLPYDMEDKLPQFLCCTCKKELTAAYIFICKARQADRILRLKQQNLNIDQIESRFERVAATAVRKTTYKKNSSPVHVELDVNDFLERFDYREENLDDTPFNNSSSSEEAEQQNKAAKEKGVEAEDNNIVVKVEEAPRSSLVSRTRQRRCVKTTTAVEKVIVKSEQRTSKSPRELKLRSRHKKSQFLCHACPRTFENTSSLRKHTVTHEPNRAREFTCEVCQRKFYNQSAFNSHLKTHDTNRKALFDCDECNKTFFYKRSLKLHQKLHKGEYVACQICDKRYIQFTDLKIHMRSHSGDMPYKCHHTDCEKAFKQVGLLNKHLRYHEGYRYKCDICDKEYNHQSTLSQHRKEHTGLPLRCALCDKGFAKRAKMRRHIKGVHGVEDIEEMDSLTISVKSENRTIQRNYTQNS